MIATALVAILVGFGFGGGAPPTGVAEIGPMTARWAESPGTGGRWGECGGEAPACAPLRAGSGRTLGVVASARGELPGDSTHRAGEPATVGRGESIHRAGEPATLVVLGLENKLEGKSAKAWRDERLGVGVRGRLVQIYADSGAFALLEEKELVGSIQEALGGYWLREKSAGELADLEGVHRSTGARWIAYGSLDDMGVTRDRVTGVVGGRRWAYRSEVKLCLHEAGGGELCEEGSGRSVTKVYTAGVEMRGDDVAFDQAGPAEAVDHALVDAFNRLMPRWEKRVEQERGGAREDREVKG